MGVSGLNDISDEGGQILQADKLGLMTLGNQSQVGGEGLRRVSALDLARGRGRGRSRIMDVGVFHSFRR